MEDYLKKKDNCKSIVSDLMTKFKKIGVRPLLKEMRKTTREWLEYTVVTEEFMRKGCIVGTQFISKKDRDERLAQEA